MNDHENWNSYKHNQESISARHPLSEILCIFLTYYDCYSSMESTGKLYKVYRSTDNAVNDRSSIAFLSLLTLTRTK